MSDTKPEDAFGEGLNAPDETERHAEFTDRADALLRWKQKTAKSKLSEMEKHTSKCGDCGMKMKKCACGATKTAQDWRINQKTDRPITVADKKEGRKAFFAREGEKQPREIYGGKFDRFRGAAAFSVKGDKPGETKLRVAEREVAPGARRGMGLLGGLAAVPLAGGFMGSPNIKGHKLKALASLGGGAALGALGGHALGRSSENTTRKKVGLPGKGFFGKDPLEDPKIRAQVSQKMKSDADARVAQFEQAKALAKGSKTKTAFINAVGPTFAASSVNAQKGELVVKTAGTKETAKRVLQFIKTNPYARDAAVSGTAGAAMGAAQAPPGARLRGAARGGAIGAGGGMIAGEMFRQLQKSAEMEDPRAVLAGKLPEKGLPKPALEKDIDDLKHKLLGTVEDYRDLRTQLTTGPKEKKVRLPKPPPEVMEKLKVAGIKDLLKDPATLAAMGLGGLAGGTGTYLASRPKKSLGGKSSGEVDLENLVSAQKARGEEGASFPRRLKNRYVEFSKGLATDFRKSPGSAAAMGAVTGATAGALAAKMLGAGK